MTDELRDVPLDDDSGEDDDVAAQSAPVDSTRLRPTTDTRRPAASAESRDWNDQGFDANSYDERPPHWEE